MFCIFLKKVSTTTTVATTTWSPTTTSAPFICLGDGNYAMPGQCSGTYYVCIDGVAYKTVTSPLQEYLGPNLNKFD